MKENNSDAVFRTLTIQYHVRTRINYHKRRKRVCGGEGKVPGTLRRSESHTSRNCSIVYSRFMSVWTSGKSEEAKRTSENHFDTTH